MRYVASLISGVGIFCVGTGLSIYHGVLGLVDPAPLEDFYWVRLAISSHNHGIFFKDCVHTLEER